MYIHIKVKTEAKEESLVKINKDHFEISVKEKAKRNMANKRIIEMVRNYFVQEINNESENNDLTMLKLRHDKQAQVKEIKIVSGHHSPSKLLSVNID